MNPSTKLREAIERAHAALERDPHGDLLRGYRETVWASLGGLDDSGRIRRARLAIASARRVLPALEGARPDDTTAHKILELAEAVLTGASNPEEARVQYDIAFVHMDNISNESDDKIPVSVGYAAVQALIAAIDDEVFDPFDIDLELTDDDTDPNDRDSGYLAAVVAAGGPAWDPASDDAARRLFWKWWLDEALQVADDHAP